MKKYLFFCFTLLYLAAHSQHYKIITAFPETNAGAYVTCVYEDSTSNYVYLAGTFTSLNGNSNYKYLVRVDLTTYAIDPTFTPISSIDGKINYMVVAGGYLYVGGNFYHANNDILFKSLIRINLAPKTIDSQWGYEYPVPISGLFYHNNFIYYSIDGYPNFYPIYSDGFKVIEGIGRLDLSGVLDTSFYIYPVTNGGSYNIYRSVLTNGNIYVTGHESGNNSFGSFNTKLKNKSIFLNTCNKTYCGGYYTGDRQEDYIYYNDSVFTIKLSPQICANHSFGFFIYPADSLNCFEYTNNSFLNFTHPTSITRYNDKIFIAGNNYQSPSSLLKYLSVFDTKTKSTSDIKVPKLDKGIEHSHSLWTFSNRLYITDSTFTKVDNVNKRGIAVLCLAPEQNINFTTFEDTVCQKQNDVLYRLNATAGNRISYKYAYSGGGITFKDTLGNTINGSFKSNAFKLNFNVYATSGTLFIYPQTDCGTNADTLSLYIHVKQNTIAYAGLDTSVSCFIPSIDQFGQSSLNNVSYLWSGPANYTDHDSIANDITAAGNYTLTVNVSNGCSNYDIVNIFPDTSRSNMILPKTIDTLTCKDSVLYFSGYSDTLSYYTWHANGLEVSPNDYYNATAPGTYFFLAQNARNGCYDSSAVQVYEGRITPQNNVIVYPLNFNPANPADTLTCKTDTVVITAKQYDANAYYNYIWSDTNNNIISTALSASLIQSGYYKLFITDTITGCKNTLTFFIAEDYNKPVISHTPLLPYLSCSADTVLVTGSSNVNNSSYNWNGPNGFTFTGNPAELIDTGIFVLTGINNYNGCFNTDTIHVGFKSELNVGLGHNKKMCSGGFAELNATTAPYNPNVTYTWSTGQTGSAINVFPTITTNFYVDAYGPNGCFGTDTVLVEVAPPFSDSIVTYAPCDPTKNEGKIIVYLTGGTAPYQYTLNNQSYQTSPQFNDLSLGGYTIYVKDTLNCNAAFHVNIDSSSAKPEVLFLSSTLNQSTDTIALVDISIPKPDSIYWHFPTIAELIDSSVTSPIITVNDTGTFVITLEAFYGDCKMSYQKTIVFGEPDTNSANANNQNGIESITITPNPSDGIFTITIKLYKQQNFVVILSNTLGTESFTEKFENKDLCQMPFNLNNFPNGTWVLKVIAEYDARHEYIIINK